MRKIVVLFVFVPVSTALRLAGPGQAQERQQWLRVDHNKDVSKAASQTGYVLGISPVFQSIFQGQVSDPEAMREQQAINIPHSGRVAILMHGEAFRSLIHGCGPVYERNCKEVCTRNTRDCTFKAADSVRANIIEQFEKHNNGVDLFMATRPCEYIPELLGRYYSNKNVTLKEFESNSQGEGVNAVMDLFTQFAAEQIFAYDTIILTRPDVVFKQPILSSIIFDLSSINFASPCEENNNFGEDCVNDIFVTMPGHFNQSFRSVSCFDNAGHNCKKRLATTIADVGFRIGYVFWNKPQGTVRNTNDWYDIC